MRAEISLDIRIEAPENWNNAWSKALFLSVSMSGIDLYDQATTDTQIEWLGVHLDNFVNYLRPLIKQLPE